MWHTIEEHDCNLPNDSLHKYFIIHECEGVKIKPRNCDIVILCINSFGKFYLLKVIKFSIWL